MLSVCRRFFAFLLLGLADASTHWTAADELRASTPPPAAAPAQSVADERLGRQIEGFSLRDYRGKAYTLDELAGEARSAMAKPIVLAFLGTECPLARLYGPRLSALEQEFASRGVAFVAISSNQQDSATELATYVRDSSISFPMLKDPGNVVADQFQARRTPEVFVLDRLRFVRYLGRIDDQYGNQAGVAFQRPKPTRRDLAEALEDILAGREVRVSATEPGGCLIGRIKSPTVDADVTYSNQIARIFQQRCVECHRPGEIAPFPLESYADAVGWGEMIREVVDEGRMPPWHANPEHGVFSNNARLSDDERELIDRWVGDGCPEGDPSQLPAGRTYAEGWRIPEPDLVIAMRDRPFHIRANGSVGYQHFEVDPGFSEDTWIKAAEVRAGNRAVVHHIIVMIKPPGRRASGAFSSYLVAMAPGSRPLTYPNGMAKKVPARSKLVFQVHYTTIGTPQEDLSTVGLVLADPRNIERQVRTRSASSFAIRIPPHAEDHPVAAWRTFYQDTLLLTLFPHAHLRGKSFRYTAHYPDGREEILLDVPHYDFNWQNTYELAEPKLMPKGTRLVCEAHYDNSANNAANPDPNRLVMFGEQTYDEMMIGYFDETAAEKDGPAAQLSRPPGVSEPDENQLGQQDASGAPAGGTE